MISFGTNRVLVLVGIILLSTSLTTGKTRRMQRVTTGIWGGVHITIEVNDRSSSITYDCATGTITGPLTFEKNGRFSWRGTLKRQRPGPTRIDDAGNESPVIYSGTVVGNDMKLSVKFAESNEAVGDFTLKRGAAGRLFRCK